MATTAARKARDIAWNVATVLAIEYVAACQALEFKESRLAFARGVGGL
jgi:histidine ammonia-lyase